MSHWGFLRRSGANGLGWLQRSYKSGVGFLVACGVAASTLVLTALFHHLLQAGWTALVGAMGLVLIAAALEGGWLTYCEVNRDDAPDGTPEAVKAGADAAIAGMKAVSEAQTTGQPPQAAEPDDEGANVPAAPLIERTTVTTTERFLPNASDSDEVDASTLSDTPSPPEESGGSPSG